MNIYFCIDFDDDNDDVICVDEDTLFASMDRYRPMVKDMYPQDGALVIQAGQQPELRIEDELWVIILHWCFRAVPHLVAGEEFEYMYFSYNGNAKITVAGEQAVISGDHIPQVTVERRKLAHELVACGERFIELLAPWQDEEPYQSIVDQLTEEMHAAQQALATWQ